MPRLIYSVLASMLLLAGFPAEAQRDGPNLRTRSQTLIDEGEGWGQRKLLRIEGEVVVTAKPGVDRSTMKQSLLRSNAPLEGYEHVADLGAGISRFRPRAGLKVNNRVTTGQRISRARTQQDVLTVNPLFQDPDSGLALALTGEILIRLNEGVQPESFFGSYWPNTSPQSAVQEAWYTVSLTNRSSDVVLALVNQWLNDLQVDWAEPVFLGEIGEEGTTSDPMLNEQWWVDHYGQNDSKTNFDARLIQAWDITPGSNLAVIAILDDGVDLSHPDLLGNLYVNPNELNNGLDDDGNGYIDDLFGYNFFSLNNNPQPVSITGDEHGTACAGMAAAVGNNGIGVAGAGQRCQFLPLKHSISNNFITNTGMAAAVRYAAGLNNAGAQVWRGADILSMSFNITASVAVSNALNLAAGNGRGGLGTVCLAAAGNNGSGYRGYLVTWQMNNFPAGNYILRMEYLKDNTASNGFDAVRIAEVRLPVTNGTLTTFEQPGIPAGWVAGGNAPFTMEQNPSFQMGRAAYQLKSGPLTDNQTSWIQTPQFTYAPGSNMLVRAWVDTQRGLAPRTYPATAGQGDTFWLRFFHVGNSTWSNVLIDCGIPSAQIWGNNIAAVRTNVNFPALHTNVIAVGGSTDQGYRYNGSQFGGNGPDFVAPTAGGWQGVLSTDIIGTGGYNTNAAPDGNYTYFSGTSASTPLAAGVAGLLLSVNPNLTWMQVRQLLRDSAEQIGYSPYVGETNLWYGHGKISAYNALLSNSVPTLASMQTETVRNDRVYLSADTLNVSNGYKIVSPGNVTFRSEDRIKMDETFEAEAGSIYKALIRPNP